MEQAYYFKMITKFGSELVLTTYAKSLEQAEKQAQERAKGLGYRLLSVYSK